MALAGACLVPPAWLPALRSGQNGLTQLKSLFYVSASRLAAPWHLLSSWTLCVQKLGTVICTALRDHWALPLYAVTLSVCWAQHHAACGAMMGQQVYSGLIFHDEVLKTLSEMTT